MTTAPYQLPHILPALRVLKQIAGETGLSVAQVSNQQVMDWVKNDESIKSSIELDASFENFFTSLVIASLRPLRQIAVESGGAIEQLTVKQVVGWFVKDGKIRREKGVDAAFLDL